MIKAGDISYVVVVDRVVVKSYRLQHANNNQDSRAL